MQTRFVDANGLRFEILEAGAGDRLALLLHGFPEHAISWRHQLPHLAALGYRVWAVNQRGYGQTTRPPNVADYALQHLIADVAALIDASGARTVTLVGHDWGAMVAWCVAATRAPPARAPGDHERPPPALLPRRPQALAPATEILVHRPLPAPPPPRTPSSPRTTPPRSRRMFAGLRLPPDILATYTAQITRPGAATAMLNWYRAARHPAALPDVSATVETPTLVIWGEDDVALDLVCLEGTERYVRHLTVERLPGISHWVQQAAPETVNRLLTAFLAP